MKMLKSKIKKLLIISCKTKRKGVCLMKKILVIDDDPMNLRMATFLLTKQSYEVVTAGSGDEGLKILDTTPVDLILLDIEMPGMDGIETFQYIMVEHIEIPVIFLTASTDTKNVIEALRLGAVDYITKPFVPEDLLGRVSKVIGYE